VVQPTMEQAFSVAARQSAALRIIRCWSLPTVVGSGSLTLLEQHAVAIRRRATLYSNGPGRFRLSYGMPENKLKLIHSMPRAFLDGLGVGVTLVDVQTGQTLFTNSTFCKMLGYTSD
jgi:PAS domain-containing protein